MEPTAQDVANVAAAIGQQPVAPAPVPAPQAEPTQPTYTPGVSTPAPEPTPAPQQQPTQPVQQPAPTSQPQDPFAMMATPPIPEQQPTQQPIVQPTPQPQQPAEPVQPAPQVQPQEQPQVQPQSEPQYQTFEQYMESVTQGIPEAPAAPDPSKIDPNDEAGIKNFFDDLVNTAVERASAVTQRNTAIQNSERALWEEAFEMSPSLRKNTELRDTVHSIRMADFRKGIATTPAQAAQKLVNILRGQYQAGVADTQVVTTIQQTQPQGGGGQPIQTTTDADNVYKALQVGGEDALAQYLDSQIKAGNL